MYLCNLTIGWGSGGSNSKHNAPTQSIHHERISTCCQTLVEPPVGSRLTAVSVLTATSGTITGLLILFSCSVREVIHTVTRAYTLKSDYVVVTENLLFWLRE